MSADLVRFGSGEAVLAAELEQLQQRLAAIEQAARAADNLQRMILDSAIDFAIVALDLDGLVVQWNSGAQRILGWTEQEMLGQPASVFFTLGDRQQGIPQTEMQSALQQGRGSDERWHLRKDGSHFWASGELMPLRDAAGAVQGFVKILRDRTEQRRAGERRRADTEFLRSILSASDDCIKVLDLEGRLTFISEGGKRMMEVDDFNVVEGCPWTDFWQGPGHDEAKAAITAARMGGAGHFRAAADTMAGTPKFWDVRVTPMFGADAQPEKLLAISRDITATQRAEAALRASEAHWRGLFERLQEGFILGELVRGADGQVTDWRYIDVNPAWGRLAGVASEAAVGRTVRELFPDIEEAWISEMATLVSTREPVTFTRQAASLGRWYEGRAHALEGDRFAVLFLEVTERRRVENKRAALLELDERLRDMDDLAAMSFVAAEIMGRVLRVNRAGYGAVDWSSEAITVERAWSLPGVPEISGTLSFRDFGSYIENLHQGEAVVIADIDQDPRTALAAAALHALGVGALVNLPLMEQGRLVAVFFVNSLEPRVWRREELAFMRNVAERTRSAVERRRAEHTLRDLATSLEQQVEERTREYDRVWHNSQDLQVVIDTAGIYRAVNPAASRLLDLKPEQMLGSSLFELVHPDDQASARDNLEQAARRELPPYLNRYRHRDNSYRWISWTTTPEAGLIYCYGRDVTAERAQAEALRRAEEALRQSQKMEAVGQLTGGLAHDFNNLLTGITGSLELLQTRITQGRIKDVDRYVNAAHGAAKRAAALTHRLLAFSRRQTLDPKPTDVKRLVGGMQELIERTTGPGIAVELLAGGALWMTLVDPSQLESALLNLCINARDAMPDGGTLTIETANRRLDGSAAREWEIPPGQYVSLSVSDNGSGMPPDVVARAFDPFFTTKPIGMGTGLGLSMIFGFAQQSGGQVRIFSEVGRGTTVCLYLPRNVGEVEEVGLPAELADAPRARPHETVLVVDDEPTVRMLVTEVLEDLGYTAIEAADGAAGLKVLQSDVRIDLLVTDVGLPGGMNGRQVADAARVTRPQLKVLFITGYAENAVLGEGHLDPGMHVLTKPFAMEALASRIKELIDGK